MAFLLPEQKRGRSYGSEPYRSKNNKGKFSIKLMLGSGDIRSVFDNFSHNTYHCQVFHYEFMLSELLLENDHNSTGISTEEIVLYV